MAKPVDVKPDANNGKRELTDRRTQRRDRRRRQAVSEVKCGKEVVTNTGNGIAANMK